MRRAAKLLSWPSPEYLLRARALDSRFSAANRRLPWGSARSSLEASTGGFAAFGGSLLTHSR